MAGTPYLWMDGKRVAAIKSPTRNFVTRGRTIYDPDGNVFVPRGVNIGGTIANNGNGWPDFALDPAFAQGMLDWHCNAVRIATYNTATQPWSPKGKALAAGKTEAEADAEIDALVDNLTSFYRARGFVTIIECHDITHSFKDGTLEQIEAFWVRYANRWKHDPYVWINIANEPSLGPTTWIQFHDRVCWAIRNTGAKNMIITDLLYFASDSPKDFYGQVIPRGYEPGRVDYLIARHGNIIASQHNYGGAGAYTTTAAARTHFQKYKDADVPFMVGEVGYPMAGVAANTGNWQYERDAAVNWCAVAPEYDIGVFWWAAAFNDAYRLEGTSANWTNGITNPFRSGAVLNEAGVMFKQYLANSHAARP